MNAQHNNDDLADAWEISDQRKAALLHVAAQRDMLCAALRRALQGAENLLAELDAHQENTGEPLDSEDLAVVLGAKADLDFARSTLAEVESAR